MPSTEAEETIDDEYVPAVLTAFISIYAHVFQPICSP